MTRLTVASLTAWGLQAVRLDVPRIHWLVLDAQTLFAGAQLARTWPWVLGRAAGITAYVLCTLLTAVGIWTSHPWSRRWSPLPTPVLLRLHVLLGELTLYFVVLHVVALAADPFAQVGLRGALIPGASVYRPFPVALGVLALYAGILTAATAALGRWIGRRVWVPLHRLSGLVLVGVWFHGVLAGSDTTQLRNFYLVSGGALLLLASSRLIAAFPGRPSIKEPATPTSPISPAVAPAGTPRGMAQQSAVRPHSSRAGT